MLIDGLTRVPTLPSRSSIVLQLLSICCDASRRAMSGEAFVGKAAKSRQTRGEEKKTFKFTKAPKRIVIVSTKVFLCQNPFCANRGFQTGFSSEASSGSFFGWAKLLLAGNSAWNVMKSRFNKHELELVPLHPSPLVLIKSVERCRGGEYRAEEENQYCPRIPAHSATC